MFSYEIYNKKNNLIAFGGNFKNYTEMCIKIGSIMQKNKNTSERKDGYTCKCYENGILFRIL